MFRVICTFLLVCICCLEFLPINGAYVIHFWGFRDGSRTDTSMVVRLKYPGKTNKENTHGHAWSVYVNPVGHDAAVKPLNARCSAAGYRCGWFGLTCCKTK